MYSEGNLWKGTKTQMKQIKGYQLFLIKPLFPFGFPSKSTAQHSRTPDSTLPKKAPIRQRSTFFPFLPVDATQPETTISECSKRPNAAQASAGIPTESQEALQVKQAVS